MAWVALDRVIRSATRFGLDAPIDRWRRVPRDPRRGARTGVDDRGVFVQAYGSKALDASCLMIPLVGFLPADDERVVATVEAIDRELTEDGFVRRYHPAHAADDGPPAARGLLMCTFWMADCLAASWAGRTRRWRFERLLALRNDVGLLAEQYDPTAAHARQPSPGLQPRLPVSTVETLGGRNGFCSRRPGGLTPSGQVVDELLELAEVAALEGAVAVGGVLADDGVAGVPVALRFGVEPVDVPGAVLISLTTQLCEAW